MVVVDTPDNKYNTKCGPKVGKAMAIKIWTWIHRTHIKPAAAYAYNPSRLPDIWEEETEDHRSTILEYVAVNNQTISKNVEDNDQPKEVSWPEMHTIAGKYLHTYIVDTTNA